MLHLIHKPSPPLAQFIECFWLVHCAHEMFGREKILPDGAVELIINLSSPQKLLNAEDQSEFTLYTKSWIAGERRSFLIVETTPDYVGLGIRFKPGGAYPFLKFPLSELNDQVVEMDLIWGDWINQLRERLFEAPSPTAQFRILEERLQSRGNDGLHSNQIVDYALQRILRLDDDLSIKSLTQELGISHKHLLRLFDREVGITPKQLARIAKFQKALQLVEGRESVRWTEIAYACNYFDQAHFIRDFKDFAGMSPTAYFAQKGKYTNYVGLE